MQAIEGGPVRPKTGIDIDADIIGLVRDILRRAILTLLALPDPDKRFLRMSAPRFLIVRDAADAYGWTPERVGFHPTPHDVEVYLDVLSWLTWYERAHRERGEQAVQLMIAWSTGAEMRTLTHRFAVSDETIRRRIWGVCEAIFWRFKDDLIRIFVDTCGKSGIKRDSSCNASDLVSSAERDIKPTPPAWMADGEKPSADETIPAVGAARDDLVARLERQLKKREAKKRHQRAAVRRQEGTSRGLEGDQKGT